MVAVHSTVRPVTVRELAAVGRERGVHVIDAPITGGAPGAAARTLTYMVGGEAELLERCRPVFETSARTIVHTGPLGTGLWMKLCNNLMTYQGFQAAFEASLLAKRAGLSFDVFEKVTTSNGNLTDQMRAFLGLRGALEARADDAGLRQLVAGFSALAEKDLSIALESAGEFGLALSGTSTVSGEHGPRLRRRGRSGFEFGNARRWSMTETRGPKTKKGREASVEELAARSRGHGPGHGHEAPPGEARGRGALPGGHGRGSLRERVVA